MFVYLFVLDKKSTTIILSYPSNICLYLTLEIPYNSEININFANIMLATKFSLEAGLTSDWGYPNSYNICSHA